MDPPLKIAPPPGATSGREFGINFCLLSIIISFAAFFSVETASFDSYSKPLNKIIMQQIQSTAPIMRDLYTDIAISNDDRGICPLASKHSIR
jgi:hypothetical protein